MEEESPQALAIKVLKAINKSVRSAVQMNQVPEELCKGEVVDLSRWSMVCNDENLHMISDQPDSCYFVDASQKGVVNMFDQFWEKSAIPRGLVSLTLKGAKMIGDYALSNVIRNNPNLTDLDITSCSRITDICLRELGIHSKKLQHLNISSCNGIEGKGLVAVAECCRQLRSLKVVKCKKLETYAISKIFYECKKLEELDIEEYLKITDNEIRILAQSSPNMMVFKAKNSTFISDQSLLILSQHCKDLDYIDVSRDNFKYRISDVGMLALGQRSAALRVLNVHGCDNITDVGLAWLAEGC